MIRITKTGYLTRRRNVYEIRRHDNGTAYVLKNGKNFKTFASVRRAIDYINNHKDI